jgi:iron complex outermembrane receptor protein
MKKFFLSCLFSTIYLLVYSQLTITGKVTDGFGLPLIGANVYIEQTYQGAVTDLNGEYFISNLKKGTYYLKVSYIGYDPGSQIIVLESDMRVDFSLTKANILADEVIVTSTRAREKSPVTYTNVTNDEIRERNLGQDIPYILGMTPSMVTSSDAGAGIGYTNFRIRGTDLNRINITVNGIPLNDAESHGVWWVDLPDFASSVDNVQIQRGVGTSVNGAAGFGATMNFQTFALKNRPYAELNSALGSYNTFKNNISVGSGLLGGKFTFDLRLSDIRSNGYIDRASSNLQSYHFQGAWYTKKSILKVNLFSGKEKTYQAWYGVPSGLLETNRTFNPAGMIIKASGDTSYYDNETDNYKQDHYQLLFSYEFYDNLLINTAMHYTYGRGYYEEYRQDQDLSDYNINNVIYGIDTIFSSDLIRQKWLDNDFYGIIWSLNYREGRINAFLGGGVNRYDGRHFGKVIWMRNAGTSEINHEWYRGTGLKTDAHVYAKLNLQVTRKLGIYGDMQYRYIHYLIKGIDDDRRSIDQEHEYNFLNPKFGIHYEFNNNQSIFFSFAMANREPNRDNFVDADPANPLPEHETLMDYEIGYKLGLNKISFESNLYFMDYANQLVLTGEINDVGAPIMTNIRDSYRAGIEMIAGIKLFNSIQWDLNLTLSRNKILGFTEFVDNWDYWSDPVNEPYQVITDLGETNLAFSPSVIAGSVISYEIINNLKASFHSKYVAKQYIDNTSSEERVLDRYFVNDASIHYSFKTKLVDEIVVNVMVNNLFNTDYETNAWIYRYYTGGDEYFMDGYFPQAGIHFLGGVALKF